MGTQHAAETGGGDSAAPDAALVARSRHGDLDAFETLLRRYQRPIYRLAARMLDDRGEAEDVTQEVFVAAWRRLPTLRDDTAIRSWLYRAAANRCRNTLRARRPTHPLGDEQTTSLPARQSASAEEHAEAAEQLAALRAALDRLTPDQRACWLLAEIEQLPYAEIAEILQVSTAAVRGRLARARTKLAEVMQPWQ